MAKKDKLSSDPAEAARKAARKREQQKNKANRDKAREFALVKKDTRTLEDDLRKLERSNGDQKEIAQLKDELRRAREAKDKYLQEHPEQKNLVYPHSQQAEQQQQQRSASGQQPGHGNGIFRPDGKPRFPERSVYYHPNFNPWGNPPPGMPYAEKPPHEWASTSAIASQGPPGAKELAQDRIDGEESSGDSDDSDDDIVMPSGPAPPPRIDDGSDSDEDDDEFADIVMPAGPPPGATIPSGPRQPSVSLPRPPSGGYTGPPPSFRPPPGFGPPMQARPPPRWGQHPNLAPFKRPPPHFQPRPPQTFSGPISYGPARPRPPPNAPTGPSSSTLPARPHSAASQTQAAQTASPTVAASATISSAPQLRNLKKEAVAFMPSAVRKQKAKASQKAKVAGLSRGVRADPEVGDEVEEISEELRDADETQHTQTQDYSTVWDGLTEEEREQIVEAGGSAPPTARAMPPVVTQAPEPAPSPASVSFSPPVSANRNAAVAPTKPPASSLVGYYEDSDEDEDEDEDDGDPENRERVEPAVSVPSDKNPPGRINLVEALRMPTASVATETSGASKGQAEYDEYLKSLGKLL